MGINTSAFIMRRGKKTQNRPGLTWPNYGSFLMTAIDERLGRQVKEER